MFLILGSNKRRLPAYYYFATSLCPLPVPFKKNITHLEMPRLCPRPSLESLALRPCGGSSYFLIVNAAGEKAEASMIQAAQRYLRERGKL